MHNKFPINAPPVVTGAHGNAWIADVAEMYRNHKIPEHDRFVTCLWVVEAQWAHPLWHSYAVLLIDLRERPGRNLTFHLTGATHELHVYACDPRVDLNKLLAGRNVTGAWMLPPNFLAQFGAPSDDDAALRVTETIQTICDGKLNPRDREVWIAMYGDNMVRPEHRTKPAEATLH